MSFRCARKTRSRLTQRKATDLRNCIWRSFVNTSPKTAVCNARRTFSQCLGPLGTYDGGREKAPAAICRKVAGIQSKGKIQIWGDGKQTRSFMYIDDCIEGICRIMRSDYSAPLNLGTDELVTVDELVDIVSQIAGKTVEKRYDTSRPQGVRGRNSDNSRLRSVLGWEPNTPLRQGLVPTYRWIEERIARERHFGGIAAEWHTIASGADNAKMIRWSPRLIR